VSYDPNQATPGAGKKGGGGAYLRREPGGTLKPADSKYGGGGSGPGFRPDGQVAMADLLAEDDPGRAVLTHPESASALRRAFELPPFTILDTRQGEWQSRKRAWLGLGIASELGRGGDGEAQTFAEESLLVVKPNGPVSGGRTAEEGNGYVGRGGATAEKQDGLLLPPTTSDPAFYAKKRALEVELGRELSTEEYQRDHWEPPEGTGLSSTGTSVFDPVLCELMYRWFSPPGGSVLDPFAGGSVRGVVAGILGRRYEGIDLSERQIEANRQQWLDISPRLEPKNRDAAVQPTWHVGDSRTRIAAIPGGKVDMVFTCPPYYNLEVYSDDPADLSTAGTYTDFLDGYQQVIFESVGRLAEGRFAVFVVGDVRDKRGIYHGLVKDTVDALIAAGADYYNHAVIVNSVGSLPVRAARQFRTMRKLGKTHQDVVIAYKGDPGVIREAFPETT